MARGGLLSKTPDPSFNAAAITFAYYPNGLRQTMADPSGTTSYAYDNRNRLQSKQTPFGTLLFGSGFPRLPSSLPVQS